MRTTPEPNGTNTEARRVSAAVESRISPNGGFGETPGKLLILSKPKPYPNSVRTPAQKLRKIPNLRNPFGRFDRCEVQRYAWPAR